MALDSNRLLKPIKKLRKLTQKKDGQSAPGKVHDLRTNARRFEAMSDALSLNKRGLGKSFLRELGRIRKKAGRVRDKDVLIRHASSVQLDGEEDCLVQLLERLGVQRRKQAKKFRDEIQRRRSSLRKGLKRTPALLARLARKESGDAKGLQAAAGAAANAVRLAAELGTTRRLGKQTLHPYRLKVKALRSVLQMSDRTAHGKSIEDLTEVKDAIGEWHDWELLVPIAEKVLDHGNRCGLLAELKQTAQRKYEHALVRAERLRKAYVRKTHPRKKPSSSASPRRLDGPVLDATELLAG